MGAIWLQVPALAAVKAAEGGKIRIAKGHTRNRCPPDNVDLSSHCYNCGETDHKVETCTRKACCPICKDRGLKDHRASSPECPPSPPVKGRSTNVNHSGGAQDLLIHVTEWRTSLVIVTEPYYVPENSRWAFLSSVASLLDPNIGRPVLLLGDFNARSLQWDKKSSTKGKILVNWAAGRGLILVNKDTTSTCVRSQGRSTVDLACANPAMLSKIKNCYVDLETPTASDHLYIKITLGSTLDRVKNRLRESRLRFPKWNGKKLNNDRLMAAIIAKTWIDREHLEKGAVEQASWLDNTLCEVSDVAMPRIRKNRQNNTYWWCKEVATLREKCIKTRRLLTRIRKRGSDDIRIYAERQHTEAQRNLRLAIKKIKNNAWRKLLETIDQDPWGRPFQIVTRKIKPQTMPIVAALPPNTVEKVLNVLFPPGDRCREPHREQIVWQADWNVQELGVKSALKKIQGNKAPGPGGVLGSVIVGTSEHLLSA
nr:PREDICTED: uncharacterized protein LOC105669256 [Linepithema humile]